MSKAQQFQRDPRSYALELTALLKYMSHDDVREALDANEMSPRFDEDDEDDDDQQQEQQS